MSRTASVVVVLLFGLVLATGSRAEDERTVKPGEKLEGEIGGTLENVSGPPGGGIFGGYHAELKLKLKAGQAVLINGTVLGDGRKVFLVLRDKTGKPVASSTGSVAELKSTSLKMKEAPSTGSYTVVVASDQVGAFTVVVSIEEELSESDLEKKIEALEKELKLLKAKLKETRDKKP